MPRFHRPHQVSPDSVSLARPPTEFVDTARQLSALFERGLDDRAQIAGWHGTSIEAIELTLLEGAFPGSARSHREVAAGHLYFFPTEAADWLPPSELMPQYGGRGGAVRYAAQTAQHSYVLRRLNLDFHDFEHHQLVYALIDIAKGEEPGNPLSEKVLSARRIDRDLALQVAAESLDRKGVLIAVSHHALAQFPPSQGDRGGSDQKIFVPNGLPLSGIAGIEPLGEPEMQYFETLQLLVERLSPSR